MVRELVTELIRLWPQVSTIEFAVEDVPPSDPAPWESHSVVVARIFPADRRRGLRDRIVVYRLPITLRCPPEEVAVRTRRALAAVHMKHCADRPVYRLSGGQKKLASIAGILTLDPALILMDEPSAALDPRNRRALIGILNALPCAKLIASHDLDFIYDTCDRVLLLHHGQLAADGPAREILRDKALLERCELELPLRWQRDF